MAAPFDFAPGHRPRRPSLTPLVDVVFLLLVFFMLAARFGPERVLPLAAPGGPEAWEGPPRLIDIGAEGLRLNGAVVAAADLAAALAPLMPGPDAPVVLRAGDGADVQALVDVLAPLRAAGFTRLVVLD